MNSYFDEKNLKILTCPEVIYGLNYLKELEIMNDKDNETDEYCKKCLNIFSGYICSPRGRQLK